MAELSSPEIRISSWLYVRNTCVCMRIMYPAVYACVNGMSTERVLNPGETSDSMINPIVCSSTYQRIIIYRD